jgi:predicted DNA-binding transcriptional regulator YafY
VTFLLNRPKVRVKELAEKFHVSTRTIYRDLDIINQAGIPVVSYSGAHGGIGIIEDFRIDKQVLSYQEMQSVVDALKGVNNSLHNEELDLIIDKIQGLLPKSRNLHSNNNTPVAIDLQPWGMSENYQKRIKQINTAIENRQVVRFTYTKIDAAPENREIEPMTIIFKGYTWYLFGYCRKRKDYRIFRISRMDELQITNRFFVRKKGGYQQYINYNESVKNVELTLKFSKVVGAAVKDSTIEQDILEETDNHIILKTKMPFSNWLYGYILSFGSFVEVLAPKNFRKIICEEAEKISKIYNKKAP